jgi:hydroxymethylglutaryl-CoA reductase
LSISRASIFRAIVQARFPSCITLWRMTLQDLYHRVTHAILLADGGGHKTAAERQLAFLKVCKLESEIASALPAHDLEGAAARCGAVRAAAKAGHMHLAQTLAAKYVSQGVPDGLEAELAAIIDEARREPRQP